MDEGQVIPGKMTRWVETPRILVTINGLQLLAYVDTGSSVTLISSSAAKRLGVDGKMRACHRKLRGVTNHCLTVRGETTVTVEIAPSVQVIHQVIVVPDEYLSTEILLGIDVLGEADFTLKRGSRSLIWGGQTYSVKKSWVYSVSRVQEEKERKVKEVDSRVGQNDSAGDSDVRKKGAEGDSQVGRNEAEGDSRVGQNGVYTPKQVQCLPGKLTEVRIENKKFKPGQMVLVERGNLQKLRACTWPHGCYKVDKKGGFILPVVNQGKRSVKIEPGHRLGTYTVVEEKDIEYVDLSGRRLGDKGKVRELMLRNGTTLSGVRLCQTHKAIITEEEEEKGVRDVALWDCDVCRWTDRVGSVTTIHNSLVPFCDTAPPTGDRQTRLATLIDEMEWGHLDNNQRDQLTKVVRDNADLFILSDTELGELKVAEAHIATVDNEPVKMPLYRHPEQAKQIIADMLQGMLDRDIIEESTAAYVSPIVLVSKPDGSKRMCIDYRGLNRKLKMDVLPLPRLDELVEGSAGKGFYTTLDLKDAYYQLKLDASSRDLTSFSDGTGLYRFKRLPFGLATSPAIFTRAMQEVLRPLVKQGWCRNYLDDVILWSTTVDQMVERLEITFRHLSGTGLRLNLSKCTFAKAQVKFLGHIVSKRGVEPDPKNVEAIGIMEAPKKVKGVRRFVGMCNFYRKHIPRFALIAKPLTNLTRKGVPFHWTEECEGAFQTLKGCLTSAPILVRADLSKQFELHTDSSKFYIAGALMQREGNSLHPIGYFSRKLNATEQNYTVTDQEALAIVQSCRFFHHYLWGKEFTVVTDHQALTAVFKRKTKCPRMSRYILEMREYCFKIQYKKGSQHTVPDALSRPVGAVNEVREGGLRPIPDDETAFPGLTHARIKELQREDPQWVKTIEFLEGGQLPKRTPGNRPIQSLELEEGLLYIRREEMRKSRLCLVVPRSLRSVACAVAHNDAHLGERKTHSKARQMFYWPSMGMDVRKFVKSCLACQAYKGQGAVSHHFKQLPGVDNPGQRMAVDLIDLHSSSQGYRYCLTVIDHYSRFLKIYPLRHKNTSTVATKFMEHLNTFGIPQVLITDNGGEFTGAEFRVLCQHAGITQGFTLPYHPRGNSVIERAHRTLKGVLAILSQQHPNTWPHHISKTEKALNHSVHTSLGTSPYFAQFNRHPRRVVGQLSLPEDEDCEEEGQVDIKELICQAMQDSTREYLRLKNQGRKHTVLTIGQLVWVRTEETLPHTAQKLNKKWRGPFRITKVRDGGRAYELECPFEGTKLERAAEKLKHYVAREEYLLKAEEEYFAEGGASESLGRAGQTSETLQQTRVRRPPARFRDQEW